MPIPIGASGAVSSHIGLEDRYLQPPWRGHACPANAVATSESLLDHLLMSFLSSIVPIDSTASSLARFDFEIGQLYICNWSLLIDSRKDPSSRQSTLGCALRNPLHQQRPASSYLETPLGHSTLGDAGERLLS